MAKSKISPASPGFVRIDSLPFKDWIPLQNAILRVAAAPKSAAGSAAEELTAAARDGRVTLAGGVVRPKGIECYVFQPQFWQRHRVDNYSEFVDEVQVQSIAGKRTFRMLGCRVDFFLRRGEFEKLYPEGTKAAPPAEPEKPPGRGGRPPKYDYFALGLEAARLFRNKPEITQAEFIDKLFNTLDRGRKKAPADSELQELFKQVLAFEKKHRK